MTKLSTRTAILDDPSCLHTLAVSALKIEDPTDINATAEGIEELKGATASSNNPSWKSYLSDK